MPTSTEVKKLKQHTRKTSKLQEEFEKLQEDIKRRNYLKKSIKALVRDNPSYEDLRDKVERAKHDIRGIELDALSSQSEIAKELEQLAVAIKDRADNVSAIALRMYMSGERPVVEVEDRRGKKVEYVTRFKVAFERQQSLGI